MGNAGSSISPQRDPPSKNMESSNVSLSPSKPTCILSEIVGNSGEPDELIYNGRKYVVANETVGRNSESYMNDNRMYSNLINNKLSTREKIL